MSSSSCNLSSDFRQALWRAFILSWMAASLGCQASTIVQDRSVLAMAGSMGQQGGAGDVVRAQLGGPELEREQTVDLDGALRLAGMENPTIGVADEMIRFNQAELLQARSLLFPSLNVGTSFDWHQGTLLTSQGIVRDLERESLYVGAGANVQGAGPVAIPGVLLTSHLGDAFFAPRVARQKVISSSYDAEATRNRILLEVADAYLALVSAEARLLVLKQSDAELAELVRLTMNFAATGQGREGDAQRARSEELLLQGTISKAEEGVAVQAAELARLLSVDPSMRLRPVSGTPPLLELVDTRVPLESLIQQALARRPEVAARSSDVALDEIRLRQERLRPLVPTLTVGFSAGDYGGGGDQVPYRLGHFGSRADFEVLAVWTAQNLGFGNRAIQNKARTDIGKAEAERARAVDLVRRQVAEARARTVAQRQQMDIAKTRVGTAQAAYREDLVRTRNLQGRLIEALASFNLLVAARQELVSALVAHSQAQVDLYVALGYLPAPRG